MLLSSTLLLSLLPCLIAADGWLDKAKAYIPSGVPINPIDAGAAKVAEKKVERVNVRNWQRKLDPELSGPKEFLLYLTGGNKTCHGRCGPIDAVWNQSVPLLAALPQNNLRLGILDCEKDEVLCTAWGATVPSIYHFLVAEQSSPQAKSPLHVVPLNLSDTTVSDITAIPSSGKSRYLEFDEYSGMLHPIDGFLRQMQLMMPFGWLIWGFGSTPSWLMMIGISFISRQIMSRRMGNRGGLGAGGIAPPQDPSRPAPAAAPAPKAAAGGAGGKKKR